MTVVRPMSRSILAALLMSLLAMIAPASAADLPAGDPDSYFSGKAGGTFGKNVTKVLPGSKRVAVTGFRVVFITGNTIKAQVRASYFGGVDRSGANASMQVSLDGVPQETLQAVTDAAYARFLDQLRAAGREVVPAAELAPFLAAVEVSPTPYRKDISLGYAKQSGVALAPAGMPLWFTNWDMPWGDKGPFSQKNIRSHAEYSEKLNAIAIAPLIVVDFAQMSSSGNRSGFLSRSAEVGASLAMSVSAFSSPVTRAEKTSRGIVTRGDDATITLTRPVASEIGFADMEQVAATDNRAMKGVFDVLGAAMGVANAGGAASSRSNHLARTNPEAYREAAQDALGQATGLFAALFAKYPAP